ncbi:hypothetical protein GCM10010404_43750 [Nonomuraea africana]
MYHWVGIALFLAVAGQMLNPHPLVGWNSPIAKWPYRRSQSIDLRPLLPQFVSNEPFDGFRDGVPSLVSKNGKENIKTSRKFPFIILLPTVMQKVCKYRKTARAQPFSGDPDGDQYI